MISISYFYFLILSIIFWLIYRFVNNKRSLALLIVKFLLPLSLCTIALFFCILYNSTVSGKLSDDEIAKSVFRYNTDGNYVVSEQFFNHKLFLQHNDNYLTLKIADEVLNNRWSQGVSNKIPWCNNQYGYSISIINDNNNSNRKGIVVFGKNKDAKTIKIKFNKNIYSTFLPDNEFFIIAYPTFETLDQDTDIYNIYSTGKSKDLKVVFYDNNGAICKDMTYIY